MSFFAFCSSMRRSAKENFTSSSSNFLPEWSEIGENSLKTRSAPPSTNSRNEAIWLSTSEGIFTSGSRNFPKNFCGSAVLVLAIAKSGYAQRGFDAPPCNIIKLSCKKMTLFREHFFTQKRVRNSIRARANVGQIYATSFGKSRNRAKNGKSGRRSHPLKDMI